MNLIDIVITPLAVGAKVTVWTVNGAFKATEAILAGTQVIIKK